MGALFYGLVAGYAYSSRWTFAILSDDHFILIFSYLKNNFLHRWTLLCRHCHDNSEEGIHFKDCNTQLRLEYIVQNSAPHLYINDLRLIYFSIHLVKSWTSIATKPETLRSHVFIFHLIHIIRNWNELLMNSSLGLPQCSDE